MRFGQQACLDVIVLNVGDIRRQLGLRLGDEAFEILKTAGLVLPPSGFGRRPL